LWLLRPVGLFSDYMQLPKNRRQAGLPRLGRSALGLLGAAFDEMRDALAGRSYVEEYVQALTHEIKSPLSAIRAAAELLDENLPAEQRRRFLGHIRDEGGRIQDIVDRLLELSALEKRRSLAELQRIELAPLLREAAASLASSAAARHIAIRCDIPEQRYVEGDRFLLLRALDNLLQNAVQFSPAGSEIEIGLESSQHHHQIAIRDHGLGIPAYAEKRVFERFYSLPRPDSGKKSTGLGLSFVKEIAELHHGQVSLTNHPQGGVLALLRLRQA
ncbi:ATP-binding protein, partial [Methylogaea oryzae]|uniref:ATP-binding protein n=1 Tax=Methylogaea oryzae TaxID=1295382 RepID=UPI000A5EF767